MTVGRASSERFQPITSRMGRLSARPALRVTLAAFASVGVLLPLHALQGDVGYGLGTVFATLFAPDDGIEQALFLHLRLPRAVAALLAGAAFGLSGAVLQGITRNPLASPGLLGVSAGAQLALALGLAALPALHGLSPLLLAFLGGLAAALLTYGIAGGARSTPLRLTLAGVAVSLALGAAASAVALLFENDMGGLFFWGAGSVAQADWIGPMEALPRIAIGCLLALLLARALDIIALGDDSARALGLGIERTRIAGVLVATLLAASAVCLAGPIGFIGLIAPNLLRLVGMRRHGGLLPLSALWGAVLLLAADTVALSLSHAGWEVPAGVVAAVIGAPLLVMLVRRTGGAEAMGNGGSGRDAGYGAHVRRQPFAALVAGASAMLAVVLLLGLSLGPAGWSPPDLGDMATGMIAGADPVSLRLPRMLVAATVGAMLAVSGLLLQGVVRNPLAGPELIGVSQASGLGALIAMLAVPGLPSGGVQVAAMAGGAANLVLLLLLARHGGATPIRIALLGLALGALCAALSGLVVAHARLQVAQALVWLAGSTYARDWEDLQRLLPWAAVMIPAALVLARWLDLLALGDDRARGLGVDVARSRLLLTIIAIILCAAAVAAVGPVAFVGLIAPHAARIACPGGHRRRLIVTVLFGAIIMAAADLLGRIALPPAELPVGIVTALIGSPYFLWMLWRANRAHHG